MTIHILLEKIKLQKRSDADDALIKKAYYFAEKAHEGQKRKSGEPYITHPLKTALSLIHMRADTPTIAAALLHDICEDTRYSIKDIEKNFGGEIAFIVEGVTKLNKIKYKGLVRSAESLRKMFLAIGEDIRIVLLKLTDRHHNMETLKYLPLEKQKRIALETLEIYAPLAYRLGITELSGKLEDLAFPYVYPQEYDWIIKTTKEQYGEWEAYVKNTKPVIARELTEERIEFLDIHARAKHYYSLYRKLLKYDMDLGKVTDLVAVRVIVPTVEHCYTALGALHKLWHPLPGRIKDYIALPKPNGYRSLHTTVFGPEGRLLEIQMRTAEMHEEAELGIAAHWKYSELKRENSKAYRQGLHSFANTTQYAWIQQLREWQKNFEKPDEFLESLKIDFFKDRIFVLTPKGDVFDLPEGATPIDFAYRVHTDIGNTAIGAKVNGKMVALDYKLSNKEIVQILTQKNKKPSRDWLTFVRSRETRKKIAAFLKKAGEKRALETKGTVELNLCVRNRIGLLRDVSHVFAEQKINIKDIRMDNKNRAYPIISIRAVFRSTRELEKIMVRLKEVKGAMEVSYKI